MAHGLLLSPFDVPHNKGMKRIRMNSLDKEASMDVKLVTLVVFGVVVQFLMGPLRESRAEVQLNIGINAGPPPVVVPAPPPAYVVPAPPPVIAIPGTYVYYAPGLSVDILFYQGHWYRPHGGYWYTARSYNGPWVHVAPARVPHALVALPHDYRSVPPGHQRIPYGQLKKNWAKWERDRHWDHRDGPGNGRGPDRGPAGHDQWDGGHGPDDRGHGSPGPDRGPGGPHGHR